MKKIAYLIVAALSMISLASCDSTMDDLSSVNSGFDQYAGYDVTLNTSSLSAKSASITATAQLSSISNTDGLLELGLVASTTDSPKDGTYAKSESFDETTGEYTATIEGLTPETTYNVWAYTISRSGEYEYSSVSKVTTPGKMLEGYVLGVYIDANGNQYDDVRLEKWSDGSYVLRSYHGYEGYDLEFSVNNDGSMKIINTLGQDSGYEIVQYGPGDSQYDYFYVTDGYSKFSESGCYFYYDNYDGATGAENWGEFDWQGTWITE